MPHTCIIGAGISGLSLAWQIQQSGGTCTLLEAATTCGGALHSIRRDGYLAETGPHSILLNSPEIETFLYSIPGLKERMAEAYPEAKKRFIVRHGKPHAVPMGPLSALTTPLWSIRGKLRVLKEPFIRPAAPEAEESVAEFVRRRLGDELYRYAINPLVGGIYAGDPEELSLRYGFPKLHSLEQTHGGLVRGAFAKMREARKSGARFRKRIVSFKDGMGELPEHLAAALGDSLQTGAQILSIQQTNQQWTVAWKTADNQLQEATFDQLIVTAPAHRLPDLPFEPTLRRDLAPLATIDYPPVSSISLGFKRADVAHPLDGFGALVPECEERNILGVLFPSRLFAHRAPDDAVLLSVFVGGERQPQLATDQTDELLKIVMPELKALLGVEGSPTFVHHTHWPKAIPQYKRTHARHLATMERIENDYPGLKLAGNYRTGISVTYCLENALAYRA